MNPTNDTIVTYNTVQNLILRGKGPPLLLLTEGTFHCALLFACMCGDCPSPHNATDLQVLLVEQVQKAAYFKFLPHPLV